MRVNVRYNDGCRFEGSKGRRKRKKKKGDGKKCEFVLIYLKILKMYGW
jgi:hypothetical protein